MKRRLMCIAFALIMIMLAGCSQTSSKTVKVEMSEKTKQFVESLGFDDVKILEKEGWEKYTLPGIAARSSGYVDIVTVDNSGNPIEFKSDFNNKYRNMDFVASFTPKGGKFNKVMLFVHGGAYISGAGSSHARFCDNLADMNNALVVVPSYGLTPQCTYKEAYEMLDKVYGEISKYNLPIIIFGDSAGGGLATGYTLLLKEKGTKMPDKVVLISPWLDITMSNADIEKYQKNDRMLAPFGLAEAGKLWAKGLNTKDYRVSPIYGDFSDFPETLLFCSTWEIFYPDEVKFAKILKDKNVPHTVVELEGFIHDAPLFSNLDEYPEFLDIIKDFAG